MLHEMEHVFNGSKFVGYLSHWLVASARQFMR